MKAFGRFDDHKVVVVGDPTVGKTSIIQTLASNNPSPAQQSTVGASFQSIQVPTSRGPVYINIWDTAGQELYKSLIPLYSRDAMAALVVIDVTSRKTFESADEWISIILSNCAPGCKFYVVANKIDLPRKVQMDELQSFASEHKMSVFETSIFKTDTIITLITAVADDLTQSHKGMAIEIVTDDPHPPKACC